MAVFTQRFKTVKTENGFRFVFFCDLCDHAEETEEIISESYEEALREAQVSAKRYFNMCHNCGKWICDEHYNEDDMQCIECSPRSERKQPHISVVTQNQCPYCKAVNANGNAFCSGCGKAI